MDAEPLMGLVALASYAVVSTAVSAIIAAAWRLGVLAGGGRAPADQARRLWLWRIAPAAAGVLVTSALVLPSHARFEESAGPESAGPVLLALAALGGLLWLAAVAHAWALVIETRLVWRAWAAGASAWPDAADVGAPAFVVDRPGASVALIGVFRPALVVPRAVIDACGGAEIAGIVAHERRHVTASDNLRRWLLASLPDVLRFGRLHDEWQMAWSDAVEYAADDEAAGTAPQRRAALAELLVKVARLSVPAPLGIVSPLIGARGLERRVRRLLDPMPAAVPSSTVRPSALAATAAAAGALGASIAPVALAVHEAVEAVVSLGR